MPTFNACIKPGSRLNRGIHYKVTINIVLPPTLGTRVYYIMKPKSLLKFTGMTEFKTFFQNIS